mmetsp:Transcript_15190/g.18493  ORF Transcript_15190/g.18493 Transcript_15190/m.18493 type:complete len:335 (-) Transcript_15190:163-1167(-)
MSLSALNYPPLIATAGLSLSAAMPLIRDITLQSPWSVVRAANLLAYGINIISVSRPGRMDGEAATDDGQLSPLNSKTLVAPSGWAFAIWAPIFLGEAIGVASQFLIPEKAKIVPLLKQTSGPFITAQLLQSLWCAAFRPKYKGSKMYISAALLSATAYALSKAHSVFTSSYSSSNVNTYTNLQYGVFFLPMALHFGWVTAASLVNLNGALALQENSKQKVIATVGHASVIGATILGMTVAFRRLAPVYSGVIAWALSAIADTMKKRLEASKLDTDLKKKKDKEDKKKNRELQGLDGASTQYILSKSGAILNAVTTAVLSGFILLAKDSKSIPTP